MERVADGRFDPGGAGVWMPVVWAREAVSGLLTGGYPDTTSSGFDGEAVEATCTCSGECIRMGRLGDSGSK